MAITYGIYDGISSNDTVLAVAVLSLTDYRYYYRDNIDEYLDYLVTLHEAVTTLTTDGEHPLQVTQICFDRELYEKWLNNNPHWQDGPDARGAWALETVTSPERLKEVVKRNPVLPGLPVGQMFDEEYLLLCVPFVVDSAELILEATSPLSPVVLNKVLSMVKEWSRLPEFEALSDKRCTGLKLCVINRFISADMIEPVIQHLAERPLCDGIVILPEKLSKQDVEKNWDISENMAIMIPLFLVIVAQGSRDAITYLRQLLVYEEGELLPLTRFITKTFDRTRTGKGRIGQKGKDILPVILLPVEEMLDMLDAVWGQLVEEMEAQETYTNLHQSPPDAKRRQKSSPFKRIK